MKWETILCELLRYKETHTHTCTETHYTRAIWKVPVTINLSETKETPNPLVMQMWHLFIGFALVPHLMAFCKDATPIVHSHVGNTKDNGCFPSKRPRLTPSWKCRSKHWYLSDLIKGHYWTYCKCLQSHVRTWMRAQSHANLTDWHLPWIWLAVPEVSKRALRPSPALH